ncbi:ATP-grasp domain-containing protein [Streptomyces sp. H27-H1]|uniref:ATP-grasp domain-containing protein n=1 Tax=Streptomyces sp. H27-H1 TaxID=2996461 RepID=UPI002270A7EC|nr:ATP-grasp domain-containing protein [Streptomyces sp. H27-H1]MCY0931523.1 ATP-grasp domain-containing protein [Streptomyces sp. H27-H1]
MSSTLPTSPRPVVLVVAPNDRLYRGYCLESVAAVYDTVVITPNPVTWEQGLVIDHETTDPYDHDALLAAGERLAARHPIAAVMTWNETLLVPTAELAQHLGVLTDDPKVLHACRDKATSRKLFAQHGVPSAQSIKVASLLESALAAESIGYPVVLKPAGQAGSVGVIRVDLADQLPAAFEFTTAGANLHGGESNSILVEEYLDGPEISVECVTHQGRTTAVAVTRKEIGFEPYFEETGHSVDAVDPLLAEVGPIARAAVAALGVTTGISHVELRLTDTGPRIIEVNQRIGGDLIGRLVQLATGIDLPRAAADLALGIAPDLTPNLQQAAAVRLLYPEVSGTVIARGIDAQVADADWLAQVSWISAVGDQVVLPPEGDVDVARVGLVVVTAADAAQAAARIEEAQDHITVIVHPASKHLGIAAEAQAAS